VKQGTCRVVYGVDKAYSAVAVVGIGEKGKEVNELEQWHEGRENVRRGVAEGILALRSAGMKFVDVDGCGYADAAGEAATLALFSYDELKFKASDRNPTVQWKPLENTGDEKLWHRGIVMGEGQNLARRLMEIPANLLYPERYAEIVIEKFKNFKDVEIHARDKAWAQEKGMGSFLSVAQGSEKLPVFLDILWKSKHAKTDKPVILVGKGVCFDSGGISLKPGSNMDKMRADMGGSACVISTLYTLRRLEAPLNVDLRVLTPLVENMPGGRASRPGDIVKAMNGKSIKIDNTDAEGRLILADALCYADTFNPSHVIDMATLTGAMGVAIGQGACGVFTNSQSIWEKLHCASVKTGDRVWRMPVFKYYLSRMKTDYADLNNIAKAGSGGGACTAAAFLKEFTKCENWAHIDIAGVMEDDGEIPYLKKGMTGRPMRTMVEFVEALGGKVGC